MRRSGGVPAQGGPWHHGSAGFRPLTVKTGTKHLESLRDNRDVYIRGERVADVTTHPAFRNSVQSAAHLYDFQSAPERAEKMTFVSPDTGDRVSRAWQLPA